jgi:serine/threonine-protein kinase RIM15
VPLTVSEETITPTSELTDATLTPPEHFDAPANNVSPIDLMETPKPSSSQINPLDEEPTPRAPAASSQTSYIMQRTPSKNART